MRILLVVIFVSIFAYNAFAQQRYAVSNGAWTGLIWAATPGGVAGSASTPTSTDDVFTNGRLITVAAAVTCKNLFVSYNVVNSISLGSGRTISITGTLSGYDDALAGEEFPTVAVISYGTSSALIFTGTTIDPANVPYVIRFWDSSVPIGRATFNFGTGNTRSTLFPLSFSGLLRIQSGTLAPDAGAAISGNGTATLTIDGGATLIVDDPISSFLSSNLSGSLFTSQSFNVSGTLNLNASGILSTSYIGGTQGWWSANNSPATLNVSATNTVNFSANGAQNVPAQNFGNLTLSGSGAKTLVGAGTLNVNGNLTISSASITFNSNAAVAINIGGNLINSGTWTPTDLVVFNGATSQTFPGSALVTFNGGFQLNKTGGNLTLNRAITTNGFIINTLNTLDLVSNTVTIPGGDINNSGTILPGTSTVLINGTSSVSGSAVPSLYNLTIGSSGNLTAPFGNLNVAGNFSNNGTFINNSGTVVFNGANDQSINGSSATTFRNLTITNTAGSVLIESNPSLRGVLTLGASTSLDADGAANNRIFTILSNADDPTQDGAIAAIPLTATLIGNMTVQRFMTIEGNDGTGLGRIYRYIASPVTGASVADIQIEIPVTGTFTGASSCSGCISTSQSMYRYNEAVLTGGINGGYEDFPSTINTEIFVPGKGYAMYVRGNILTSARFDLRGSVTRGDQNLGVTFTSSGTPANDGWNLVGNPYPSTIDWNATGWTKTNLDNTISIRNNVTNNYATYNGVTNTNGGTQYIASGQGFWVQANAASPSLQLTENVKAPGQITSFFRESSLTDIIRITLMKGTSSDETVIHFREDATETFDNHADSRKLKNSIFNLSSLTSDQVDLAINSQPTLACGSKRIKLKIADIVTGNYALDFTEFESFPSYIGIVFHDNFIDSTISIRNVSHYRFDVTTDVTSFGADRFTISFMPDAFSLATASEQCMGSTTQSNIEIQNSMLGVTYSAMFNGIAISESVNGNGQYLSLPINVSPLTVGKNSLSLLFTIEVCNISKIQSVELNLLDKPKDAVITLVNGDLLVSSYPNGSEWYFNGELIQGESSDSLSAVEAGVYRVETTVNGCVASGEYEFIVLSEENTIDSNIRVSPNPVIDNFKVSSVNGREIKQIVLYNSMGIKLDEQESNKALQPDASFNMQQYSSGVYFVKIVGSDYITTIKILKK